MNRRIVQIGFYRFLGLILILSIFVKTTLNFQANTGISIFFFCSFKNEDEPQIRKNFKDRLKYSKRDERFIPISSSWEKIDAFETDTALLDKIDDCYF